MRRRDRRPNMLPFVDLMMSTLIVFTALLMASNAVKKADPKKVEESGLKTDGALAIVMEWPNESRDDIDLYVRDPNGKLAFYSARDVGLMHLEHDDQGTVSDRDESYEGDVTVERNEERVIIRGTIPGEYVVNVMAYSKKDQVPTPVSVRLVKLKGEDSELAKQVRILSAGGDEATAFRFTAKPDGTVGDVNELPMPLARQRNPANPFGGGGN